jgi:hypothetical protein
LRGKDFPHASGEFTRGLAPLWSEARRALPN